MGKYAKYKHNWYEQKKRKTNRFCACGKQIGFTDKKCGSCSAKERSKLFPPPNRKGKQKHLLGNKFRVGFKPIHAGKHFYQIMGEKHPNWKGGITPINDKIRKSLEYKLWRISVFKRDNWICQKYKIRGGELVVHHIENFDKNGNSRLDTNNGITLSKKAHTEFHKKYGFKNNTKEQLQEFLI